MSDEQRGISFGVEKNLAYKIPFEFIIPCSRSLLQAIKSFVEFTNIALFVLKPSGCVMYISSKISPLRKALLTSIYQTFQPFITAKLSIVLTVEYFTTGLNVSE